MILKLSDVQKKLDEVEKLLNGKGNPNHDPETGRFTFGPGTDVVKRPTEKKDLRVVYEGQKMTAGELKKRQNEERENSALDRIKNNSDRLKELEKEVMSEKGWLIREENGVVVGYLDRKINKIALGLGKDDVRVMNNGKKYLEDENEDFYRSSPSNEDGLAVYTIDKESTALTYADGKEEDICHLVIDKSKFVTQSELNKARKRIASKASDIVTKGLLIKSEDYTPVRDTTLASMLGYDGIIRRVDDQGKEYIVINPDLLRLDKIPEKNQISCLIEKIDRVLNGGPGSGNFGHLGRPGLVGGSSSREALGYNIWQDTSLSEEEKRDVVRRRHDTYTRYRRMRKIDSFTPEFEKELKEAKYSEEEIQQMKLALASKQLATLKKRQATRELKEKNNTEARNKALTEIESKIEGFYSEADEKWFKTYCDEESAIALNNELDRFKKEYGLDPSIVQLRCFDSKRRTGQASFSYTSYGAVLTLEKNLLKDYDTFEQATGKRAEELGWWTTGEASGVIKHELGHVFAWQLMRQGKLNPRSWLSVNDYIVKRAIYNVIGENNTQVGNLVKTLSGDSLIKYREVLGNKDGKYMSKYGISNTREMVAESFANPNYSALTKEIVKVAKKGVKAEDLSMATGVKVDAFKASTDIRYMNGVNSGMVEGCSGMPASEEDFYALGLRFENMEF